MKKEVLLTIITPYYNTLKQTNDLAKVLEPQLTDEIEWIIIDDGCNEKELDNLKATVIHIEENTGGASIPRNIGLDNAKGKYISFIDSDDLVTSDYIETIINKTKEDWDYCLMSWKGHFEVIIKDKPPTWNCCVWNCIYKKELIGNTRFKPELKIGEDYDFNLVVRKGKKANIEKILYYYQDTPNSLIKSGETYNKKYKVDRK